MLFFERDLAIDPGTSSVLVYVHGKGIALREPTVVAVDKLTGKLLRVGEEAQKMLGRTPGNIVAIHPITHGVISDYDMTQRMLQDLISRVTSFSVFKPRAIVCVPSSISGVEERAMIDACIEAGARRVYLLESAVAVAVGAGVDVSRPEGRLVVDIGGGTTEVAVVSLGGVVECESIKIAGAAFDEAIIKYIRRKHGLLIGSRTAEELKLSLGCVYPRRDVGYEEVKGRGINSGLPESAKISSTEMAEALAEPAGVILDAIHTVIERTPPELVADISAGGIIMSGGGSLLWGLDQMVADRTGIETTIVDDAQSTAAYGAGKMLRKLDDMQEGMINFARQRQMKA